MAVLGAHSGAGATTKAITQIPAEDPGQVLKSPRPIKKMPVSPAAHTIKITVNKWAYELQVDPEWALRDVLRNQLGFLSIKDMCNGYGAYGVYGCSESGTACTTTVTGPAIHNAIGRWIDDFPTTPDKVLKALGKI